MTIHYMHDITKKALVEALHVCVCVCVCLREKERACVALLSKKVSGALLVLRYYKFSY